MCVISIFCSFCNKIASKNIVVDVNKWEKLDGENYDIWHHKIQYVLDGLEVLAALTHYLNEPKKGDSNQNKSDHEAYIEWDKRTVMRVLLY